MTLNAELDPPWLVVDLGAPHRCLSWAVHRPGSVVARHVAWLQVRDAELPPGVDPAVLLAGRLAERGLARAVGLLTARTLAAFETAAATVGDVQVQVLMTLGLSNAAHVAGGEPPAPWRPGTINLLARLSQPLAAPALIEAVSIATEARTAALIEAGWCGPHGGSRPVTGTGTDCIVVAVPARTGGLPHAGLHTPVGQALGRAVYAVTARAAHAWLAGHAAAYAGDRTQS